MSGANPVTILAECHVEDFFGRGLRNDCEKINRDLRQLRQRCAAWADERGKLLAATLAGEVSGADLATRAHELDPKAARLAADVDSLALFRRKESLRTEVSAVTAKERQRIEAAIELRWAETLKRLDGLTTSPGAVHGLLQSDSVVVQLRGRLVELGEVPRAWLTDREREFARQAEAAVTALLSPPQAPQVSGIFK